MTTLEVLDVAVVRKGLQLTQDQFAQLLGVHSLTVSKWERGKLQPSPYQHAMMQAFEKATKSSPNLGASIATALVGMGVGFAVFMLLKAAFGNK